MKAQISLLYPPSRPSTALIWSTLSVWDLSTQNQEALATDICQTFIELMSMSDESQTVDDEQMVSFFYSVSSIFWDIALSYCYTISCFFKFRDIIVTCPIMRIKLNKNHIQLIQIFNWLLNMIWIHTFYCNISFYFQNIISMQ